MNRNIKYYYDNMESYAEKVRELLLPFYNEMKKISKEIKSIGGLGNIHGCIVDISYYNHIYLNIADGSKTPYYAIDEEFKIPYDSLLNLLKNELPQLVDNYKSESEKGYLAELGNVNNSDEDMEIYSDTYIYKPSNKMRRFQYLLEDNIIRIWNDSILEKSAIDSHNRMIELFDK